jgi:hypothetical protein
MPAMRGGRGGGDPNAIRTAKIARMRRSKELGAQLEAMQQTRKSTYQKKRAVNVIASRSAQADNDAGGESFTPVKASQSAAQMSLPADTCAQGASLIGRGVATEQHASSSPARSTRAKQERRRPHTLTSWQNATQKRRQ